MLGLNAPSVMGRLGSPVQFFVRLVRLDFLNMSGGFSDLGCHSSSHNFICLQFPVLNPFLPEIPRIVYIFGLNLD